jgi:S-DNA-T family DNA segregation ATPase FtsK/SpoIIIE
LDAAPPVRYGRRPIPEEPMSSQTLIDEPLKIGEVTEIPADIEAKLLIVSGPDSGRIIPLKDPITLLGRDKDCHVQIDDPRVSGRHAAVYFAGGEFRIRDLASTNGTLLNGSALTDFAFADGDDARVGKSVLRLVVDFKEEG